MTRTRFTGEALVVLKEVFSRDQTPSARTRQELAARMDVTPRAVQVWFQNQRQRQKAAQMHAARTLSFTAHGYAGLPMSRSMSSDRAISAELLTQLRGPPSVGETPTQTQIMQADADSRAYPPQQIAPPMGAMHPQAFYGTYCNNSFPPTSSPPTAPVSPQQPAPPQPPAMGRVDSLADLAEVAGMSKLLDKSNSIYDLASLSRNGSLADLASLSRSGSLKDLASLSRNGSLKDLARVGSLKDLNGVNGARDEMLFAK